MRFASALLLALLAVTPRALAQDDEPPPLGISTGRAEPPPTDEAPPLGVSTGDATEPDATPEPEEEVEPAEEADRAATGRSNEAPDGASAEDPTEDPDDEDDDGTAPAGPPGWTEGRVIGWATLGTSFAVALAGGILLAVGLDAVNTVENAPDGTSWSAVADARDRAPILTGAGIAVLALGAVGTAVGAGLVAHFGEGGTWVTVSALPGGIAIRGRF